MPRKKANRKLNHRLIKSQVTYEVKSLAKVLDVCVGTTRNMIKAGMPIVEGSYPQLIKGEVAISYIKEMKIKCSIPLKQDEFYCMHCGKGSKPSNGVAWLEITAPKVGNLKSYCAVNGITKINRRISLQDLPKFHEVMHIHKLQDSLLRQGLDSSVICETEKDKKNDKI